MIDVSHVSNQLSKVQLETDGLKASLNQLAKHIENSVWGHGVLLSSGFLPLVSIATNIHAWNYGSHGTVQLDIPWDKRTEARRLYGGCFPINVERVTRLDESLCRKSAQLFKVHRFIHEEDKIEVKFYRDTFVGDKIDGCDIKMVSSKPNPYQHIIDRNPGSHLAIVCPI